MFVKTAEKEGKATKISLIKAYNELEGLSAKEDTLNRTFLLQIITDSRRKAKNDKVESKLAVLKIEKGEREIDINPTNITGHKWRSNSGFSLEMTP